MQKIGRWLLELLGWELVGEAPKTRQCVFIFAPHTSNWDFVILLLVRAAVQLRPKFIGKHTIFWPPLSWFLRAMGGRPVDRSNPTNIVQQIVDLFKQDPDFQLAISPEGTRSKKDHWKTGFYRIAEAVGVPIQLVFLDKRTKQIGMGPMLLPSGDIEKDFEFLRAFYQDKQGFRPEYLSDIRPPDSKPAG